MTTNINDEKNYLIHLSYTTIGGRVIHADNAVFDGESDRDLISHPNGMPVTLYIKLDEGATIKEVNIIPNSTGVPQPLPVEFKTFQPKQCEKGEYNSTIVFTMPEDDVTIFMGSNNPNKEPNKPKFNNGVVDTFDLPEEIAYELSDLLTKQTIRERLLMQAVGDPTKFDQIEGMLIPITSRIEALKNKITMELVPDQYCAPQYIWSYNGVEIDGVTAQVILIK